MNTYRGIRRFQRTVIRTLTHDPPALVYCHDADTLKIGCALKEAANIPFVFDMHDLQHTWIRYAAPQSRLRSLISGQMKQRMLSVPGCQRHSDIKHTGERRIITRLRSMASASWIGRRFHRNRPLPPFGPSKHLPKNVDRRFHRSGSRLKAFELLVSAVKTLQPHERPKIRVAGDGTASAKYAPC